MRFRPILSVAAAGLILLNFPPSVADPPIHHQAPPTSPYWKQLAAPVRLLDGTEPIDVDRGHAAPAVFDLNGDGLKDLLVGQFGEGKLRVYPNRGSDRSPRFDGFVRA